MQHHSKTATAAATNTYKAHTLASTHAALPVITPSVFDHLPDSALVRESQLVQSPKRPHGTAPLPFSAATLWRKSAQRQLSKAGSLVAARDRGGAGDVRAWLNACGWPRERRHRLPSPDGPHLVVQRQRQLPPTKTAAACACLLARWGLSALAAELLALASDAGNLAEQYGSAAAIDCLNELLATDSASERITIIQAAILSLQSATHPERAAGGFAVVLESVIERGLEAMK